jgi:hypothetical protein
MFRSKPGLLAYTATRYVVAFLQQPINTKAASNSAVCVLPAISGIPNNRAQRGGSTEQARVDVLGTLAFAISSSGGSEPWYTNSTLRRIRGRGALSGIPCSQTGNVKLSIYVYPCSIRSFKSSMSQRRSCNAFGMAVG